ncbi:MAG: response regulator [Dehalococcoidales bacterium]|nr:response regulator [Dehalococcoidales bacterium]
MTIEESKTEKRRILIADDEEHVRSLLNRILSRDYVILEANDGQQVLNMAYSHSPDIILMDIMMPKINGDVACHIIKTNPLTRDIPIIMLTALDYELNKKLSLDVMGADDYITKPFEAHILLEIIDKLLNK